MSVHLSRRILRKLHISEGRSSYPFISGDTYANLCSLQFTKSEIKYRRKRNHPQFNLPSLFLDGRRANAFIDFLAQTEQNFSDTNLVIHNCDKIPDVEGMHNFAKVFNKVFSVNWLGSREIATPIPIGLENWGRYQNGVPLDYLNLIQKGIPAYESREINLLSSFSTSTNISERTRALNFLSTYPAKFQSSSFLSSKNYRELLLKSKFVISPPGNGPDCHRTWEAMYLGAIPIVLRSAWPFSPENLPVLEVEDWDEIPAAVDRYIPTDSWGLNRLADKFLGIS